MENEGKNLHLIKSHAQWARLRDKVNRMVPKEMKVSWKQGRLMLSMHDKAGKIFAGAFIDVGDAVVYSKNKTDDAIYRIIEKRIVPFIPMIVSMVKEFEK